VSASVSVWSCPLDLPDRAWRRLSAVLPPAECREAEQRPDPLDRRRFTAARAWRRRVLADELGCDPAAVPITIDPGGKPRLTGGPSAELRFSASRSAGLALVACSWEMEVGVDIEAVDPGTDVERFAARFFTAAEQRVLADLPGERRCAALFQCWARKEAYLKGTGEGLAVPTSTIEVWQGDDRPVTVGGWRIHSLTVPPGFAAALAGFNAKDWLPSGPRQRADTLVEALCSDG
jgi:4'-phosphopantetheinyl transferase